MAISRRKFLQAGTVIALAAGVPLKAAITSTRTQPEASAQANTDRGVAAPGASAAAAPLPFYAKATFTAQLNSSFLIHSKGSKTVEATLVQVKSMGPSPDKQAAGRECFALVFNGGVKLPQDVYSLEHAALGKFSLLLVPNGKDKKGWYYEALINRLNG